MAEEIEKEDLEEGFYVVPSDPRWLKVIFTGKEVLEFETYEDVNGSRIKVTGALLVNSLSENEAKELLVYGRYVGCDNEEVTKSFSNNVNRRNLPLHMCQKDPCDAQHLEVGAHVHRARWFKAANFGAPYMKPWGTMVLREAEGRLEGEKPGGEKEVKPRASGKKPAMPRGVRRPPRRGDLRVPKGSTPGRDRRKRGLEDPADPRQRRERL